MKKRGVRLPFYDRIFRIENILGLDSDFSRTFEDYRDLNESEIEELVNYASDAALSEIYRINQFLNITPAGRDNLRSIYRET